MATESPQLLQLLNTLSGEQYAKMMAESPHLKGWVNETNYQHPSLMKNIQANYQNQPVLKMNLLQSQILLTHNHLNCLIQMILL